MPCVIIDYKGNTSSKEMSRSISTRLECRISISLLRPGLGFSSREIYQNPNLATSHLSFGTGIRFDLSNYTDGFRNSVASLAWTKSGSPIIESHHAGSIVRR